MPSLLRYSPTNLYDGAQIAIFGDILRRVLSASRVHHVSDPHPKFALRRGSMVDIQSPRANIRRGKKQKDETTGQNIMPASATQRAAIKSPKIVF